MLSKQTTSNTTEGKIQKVEAAIIYNTNGTKILEKLRRNRKAARPKHRW
jgi:hypothetical protein